MVDATGQPDIRTFGTLTREEVLDLGKEAIIDACDPDGISYRYDGEHFFWSKADEKARRIPRRVAPPDGWRHAGSCSCDYCRRAA